MDYYLAKKPLNNDVFCGDTGTIKKFDDNVFIGIIDVLGHGKEAHAIALICEDFLKKSYRRDLIQTIKGLDNRLRGTRGAVGALVLLALKTGVFKYVGIGDTSAKTFGARHASLISKPGILGYYMPSPKEETKRMAPGDVLVLATDGVRANFNLDDYPGLLGDDAQTISTNIIKQFGKAHDDALCIVLKYTPICVSHGDKK